MSDLAAEAARVEAQIDRVTPEVLELLRDQAEFINTLLEADELPAAHPMCGCKICERRLVGERLRDRHRSLRP